MNKPLLHPHSGPRAPKMLMCLHTFCFQCIKTLTAKNGVIMCSMCRQSQNPAFDLRNLLDNTVIVDYLRWVPLLPQFGASTTSGWCLYYLRWVPLLPQVDVYCLVIYYLIDCHMCSNVSLCKCGEVCSLNYLSCCLDKDSPTQNVNMMVREGVRNLQLEGENV